MASKPSVSARLMTFARSLLTGGAATLTDLAVLAFAVGVLHVAPRIASLPALFAGAVVQFFGNRHFAFRAKRGALSRQATLFVITEAIALALNGLLFNAVATSFPLTTSTALVARAITTNVVFLAWSYPVWRRVFRPTKSLEDRESATS